jgi:hypothetical protein
MGKHAYPLLSIVRFFRLGQADVVAGDHRLSHQALTTLTPG